jgi:hypothetical protein
MRDNVNIHRIDPVCRFGPGGDFVRTWPCNPQDYLHHSQSPLTRLLSSIAKMVGVQAEAIRNNYTIGEDENESVQTNNCRTNAPADANPQDNSEFCGQILLFADDSRACRRAEHKPKHRVRTHRRAAKKRPALRITAQGSLFEADAKSAKTA